MINELLKSEFARPARICSIVTGWRGHGRLVLTAVIFILLPGVSDIGTTLANGPPILISNAASTRAVAFESVTFLPEPFTVNSPTSWGTDRHTRVMLFALNLPLHQGDDLSVVIAEAEDASHQRHLLTVESITPVSSFEWVSAVVLKLNDDLADVGDVLVRVTYQGSGSNRVRLGMGHIGGGLPDDQGASPTPAPPYYTVAGQVNTSDGNGLAGVTVSLIGTQGRSVTTGADGRYSFFATAGDYTVSPTIPFYSETPMVRWFTNLNSDLQNVNFIATRETFSVSGSVVDDNGQGISGSILTIVDTTTGITRTVTTRGDGGFSVPQLPAGDAYNIAVSNSDIFEFIPQHVDLLVDNVSMSFGGTRKSYSIRGTLSGNANDNVTGVVVTLTGPQTFNTYTAVSDINGNYAFAGLPAGFNYVVAPDATQRYGFNQQTVFALTSDRVLNFNGWIANYFLAGLVQDSNGNGLAGITITLSGSRTGTTTTAADGSYYFLVPPGGSYVVTPSIPQDYYSFLPQNDQVIGLLNDRSTIFHGTFNQLTVPTKVLAYDGSPKTVDYGPFWQGGVNLGHFFWEFWAMPGDNAGATYLVSDGYGGAHALLFGFGSLGGEEPGRYQLIGNILNNITFQNYFGSDQGPTPGEWGHFAVGWDGQYIITYLNGVPVGKTPFSGPRLSPGPGGGGGRLLIGGSDHSNFEGRIAQVRGYEDRNPREASGPESSFAPESVFSVGGNLLSYYFRPDTRVADLSSGYRGVSHLGLPRGTTAGILADCGACPPPEFVVDPTAPNFVAGTSGPPMTTQPPLPVPDQAIVFDSFSRTNSTYTFGSAGGLGSTEGGSLGPRAWRSNESTGQLKPFGILNGVGVVLGNATYCAWVPTSSSGNLDVRIDRRKGSFGSGVHTGLSFRVVDGSNYFFAYTSDNPDAPERDRLNLGYFLNGVRTEIPVTATMPSVWTTLRVVTQVNGSIQVFADGTLVFSTNSTIMASADGAGIFNNSSGLGLVNRWDNFTVLSAP